MMPEMAYIRLPEAEEGQCRKGGIPPDWCVIDRALYQCFFKRVKRVKRIDDGDNQTKS